MEPKKRVSSRAVLLGLMAAMASSQPAAGAVGGAVANTAATQASSSATEGAFTKLQDIYDCSCVQTYRDGSEASVSSCDDTQAQCADLDVMQDCQDDPDGPDCNYLVGCECDCTALGKTVEFEHGPFDDVMLTGVPDLWQFNYMCGSNSVSANAVGCGPVSAAMLIYWWAQRGYGHLVDDFLVGAGSGPAEQEHDWQALVRELRAHYLDGGICSPFGGGQYATLMGKMATGLKEYIDDAGYNAVVKHWKVCDDCRSGAADEINGGTALDIIKDELEAGRPVIMGFNSGRAFDAFIPAWNGEAMETVYIGELSNGTPIAGTIDHYAVITGYRRLDGIDVLTMNLGWEDGITDVNLKWTPAGKWLHLYTVNITSQPDADEWCSIDRGVDENFDPPMADAFSYPFVEISHVESSTPSSTLQVTPLAGTSCGIAREGETVSYYDTTHEEERCVTPAKLPDDLELPDKIETTDTAGSDRGGPDIDYGPPIADHIDPLP
jgi:hypothetical protein